MVSALVELDKNYTQDIADSLVFINDKADQVKNSLEDKVNTLLTLEKGMVDRILAKDRKTIDQRDTLLNTLYWISQHMNQLNDPQYSMVNTKDQYLYKKQAVTDIMKMMKVMAKAQRKDGSNNSKTSYQERKVLASENLQKISKNICCLILQNKIKEQNSIQFNYLKPEIYAKMDTISNKLEGLDNEITNTNLDFQRTLKDCTLTSLHGLEMKKFEILNDFLLNNSKRIIEIIENPKSENELYECLFSPSEGSKIPGLNNPDTVGVIEEDNVEYATPNFYSNNC